jgi:multidrug efflux system outer membrane protein
VQEVDRFSWLPPGWEDSNDAPAVGEWWKRFADPVTDELVQKALSHNTDVLAAMASVDRSRALLAQAHGARLPDVSYGIGRDRSGRSIIFPDINFGGVPMGGRQSLLSETFSQTFTINYVTDLFGKLRRMERAALNDLLASEADRQALLHTIIAQVVQTRIQIAIQQRLLQINDATIENWQRAVEVTESRYEGGLTSPLDVYFSKQNLTNAKVRRNQVEQQLVLLGHALDVLCGQAPATTKGLPETLPELPELAPVPAHMPSHLLDHRPDVQAAEMRLAAATEQVGVSIAQLYPDLTIGATGGISGDRFSDMFDIQNKVWSLLINLGAPIFNGGRLRAGVRAARAQAEQVSFQYAGVVLKAFQEVEDALASEQFIQQRIELLNERVQLAMEAEQLARERYMQGVDPILVVLEAERTRRLAQNELVLTQGRLWEARVKLFLSLGGSWIEPGTGQDSEWVAGKDGM